MKPGYFYIASLALISLPSVTFADSSTTAANNFIGAGLGANVSSFSTANPGVDGNTKFTANAFTDWGLGNIWYLQTGLRYASYGYTGSNYGISENDVVHYLEVPVLIKSTFDAGGWFPYLMAGPNLGFKVGEGVSLSSNGDQLSAITPFFKTFNLSTNFGAGAEIPITPGFRAYLQFDYALGLVNVFNYGGFLGGTHTRGANITAGAMMAF